MRARALSVAHGLLLCAGLLPALVLTSCTTRLPGRGSVSPGDYIGHLDSREGDLRRRSYLIHVARRDDASPPPVVLVLHGAFSTAPGIEERSGFSRLADEEGFVAVYPNGYGILGLLRHWNAGYCCGRARSLGLDDVAFLDAVLADVAGRIEIDATRIFVVGESNGAMLAYRYAAVRSGRIAGAAAVMGAMGSGPAGFEERIPPPEMPVPMVIVHGSADSRIPFHGGSSARDPEVSWVSAPDSAAFWVAHNGAQPDAQTTTLYGGRVVRSVWHGEGATAPVALYEVRDWPHLWPGPNATATLAPDDQLRGFDAARVVWEELRSHSRE
jgi:polyhydroxybutyrate depolymerase